jgi:SOS response regulatory protein OraA/RecX
VGAPPARRTPTPLDVAARVLARGSRTEAELAARLEKIGYSAGKVADTIARCRELRYLDDGALAMDRARTLRLRGVGSLRIAAELEARGVPESLAAAAVAASLEGEREAAWARRALTRLRVAESRAWHVLCARGFPEDVVVEVLGDLPGA